MSIDYKALREAAEKATPGPWQSGRNGNDWDVGVEAAERIVAKTLWDGYSTCWSKENRAQSVLDAAFIALANPSTILTLLDALKESEERGANAQKFVDFVATLPLGCLQTAGGHRCPHEIDAPVLPNTLAEARKATDELLSPFSGLTAFGESRRTALLNERRVVDALLARLAGLAEQWNREGYEVRIRNDSDSMRIGETMQGCARELRATMEGA